MKKLTVVLMLFYAALHAQAGTVGLPVERIILPSKASNFNFSVRVWDYANGAWLGETVPLARGVRHYDFQYPEWGKMYWVGLWNADTGQFVFGKTVGQYKTDGSKVIL